MDSFQIGKGVHQGCILLPCLLNLYAEYIVRNAGLDEVQAGIKTAGRNINNLRYADDTTLMPESEEELKSSWLFWKRRMKSLKLIIQKTKILASCPITSWQIAGETMETVRDFIFSGSKNHCIWWLQPWNLKTLAPWKKSYDKLRQNIKKQRHYFTNKGPSSQSYGFSSSYIWMRELDSKESWVPKISCFWTVALEKTLESPLDSKVIQPVS